MQSKAKKKAHLSCRVDTSLLNWVKWFAKQNQTTVTQLIVDYFVELREANVGTSEVDQV